MITLASIAIAVPLGVLGGLAQGIAAWRWPWVERLVSPILELMQTIPTFAFLVPILVLFGLGPVAALLAITALAEMLDRSGQAMSERVAQAELRQGNWWKRHPRTTLVLVVALASGALGYLVPALQDWPKAWQITAKPFWSDLIEHSNVNYFDQLEAVRVWFLEALMLPVKRYFLALPWPFLLAVLILGGWRFGGVRLAALGLFVATTGLWKQAMIRVHLCGLSVVIAMLIGVPLGILAAANETAGKVIGAVADTLQTLPSFVYLIPVVMLFRVGDFSAMIAVVLFALVPAVKYTAHGLRSVPRELIEAGVVCGSTRAQILRKVQ